MKYLKFGFLSLAITVLLSSASTAAFAGYLENYSTVAQEDTTKTEVVRYEVFGMDCPGCQSALEKQVEKIEGVEEAKASFKEKVVVVELKPNADVSDEEIEQRIKKANFTPGKKIEPGKDED